MALVSPFCVIAVTCLSISLSKGPVIAQSCGTITFCQAESSKLAFAASAKFPLLNFHQSVNKISLRCAITALAEKMSKTTSKRNWRLFSKGFIIGFEWRFKIKIHSLIKYNLA